MAESEYQWRAMNEGKAEKCPMNKGEKRVLLTARGGGGSDEKSEIKSAINQRQTIPHGNCITMESGAAHQSTARFWTSSNASPSPNNSAVGA